VDIDAIEDVAAYVLEWMMPLNEFAALRGLPWQEMLLQGTWLAIKNGIILGAMGWMVGWGWERYGLSKLAVRERDVSDIRVGAHRYRATDADASMDSRLLEGSVVISHDLFRGFTIFFARILGGRISMYECLFERARREAIVRLKECARGEGYTQVVNLKIVSTRINREGPATVGVLVFGTGL